MRYIRLFAVIILLLILFGSNSTAETQAVETTRLQPLSIEIVGESVSKADGDVWYYWEITNPNDQALGFRVDLAEEGTHDIPKEYIKDVPRWREEISCQINDNGTYSCTQYWESCSMEYLSDIYSKRMRMIPANSSIIVYIPPVMGGIQEATVSINENCDLQIIWHLYPTNEVVLLDQEPTPYGDLKLTIGATKNLEGKAFVHVQVVLLNEAGEVVQTRYRIAGEFERITAGEQASVYILDVDKVPFTSYKVNILGLYH